MVYQLFGLFITIIVLFGGGVATYMSYLARKSVQEFIADRDAKLKEKDAEWDKKLTEKDAEWDKKLRDKDIWIDSELKRAQEAQEMAKRSAAEAQHSAGELQSSLTVLNLAIERVAESQNRTEHLEDRLRSLAGNKQDPTPVPTIPPSTSAESTPGSGESVNDPISAKEQDSINALIRDRLPSEQPAAQ